MTTPEYKQNGRKTILAIEDDAKILDIYSKAIPRWGYDIITASNGLEGVAKFEANPYEIDLVLSDCLLGDITSEEIYDRISTYREIPSDLPFILASGTPNEDAVKRTIERGVTAFITKPFEFSELKSALRQALE